MNKAKPRTWLLAVTTMGAALAADGCSSGSSGPFTGDTAAPLDGGTADSGLVASPLDGGTVDSGLVASPLDGGDAASDAGDAGDAGDGG
jgi:hypothetical protein